MKETMYMKTADLDLQPVAVSMGSSPGPDDHFMSWSHSLHLQNKMVNISNR